MKGNDPDISEESQRELALDVFKQAAQRELAAGVLKRAARDFRRFHGATSTVERELYLDAHRWLMSDDCAWPFSFVNVCDLLGVMPVHLRQELIGDLSLGAFTYRARRWQRAAPGPGPPRRPRAPTKHRKAPGEAPAASAAKKPPARKVPARKVAAR